MPEALYFTEDEAANRLLADDPFALLVGFALDQQVTVQQAFLGPLRLKERLGTLEPRKVAKADLEPLFREKPAIHRFPGSMAGRVRELAATVAEEYDGDASRLWTEAADGADLRRRISALPGFGEMKVKALGSVLAKRFGVPVAQELVPAPSDARGRRLGPGARRLPGREESAQGRVAGVEVRTLTDGGQPAEQTAHALAEFFAAAKQTLEIAVYDVHLPPDLDEIVCGELDAAQKRGVAVRLAYNLDHAKTCRSRRRRSRIPTRWRRCRSRPPRSREYPI